MNKKHSLNRGWADRFQALMGVPGDDPIGTPGGGAIELLTPAEMTEADRRAVALGQDSYRLMERAGAAVAAVAGRMVEVNSRIIVLAGPGNNGGDGFVAARFLAEAGYQVVVALHGDAERLKGDAATAAKAWSGKTIAAEGAFTAGADLIIDALFGAGLDRPVQGVPAGLIEHVNNSGLPVLAVDLPSGIDGATGRIQGYAVHARETVTFYRRKPGHLLIPGRLLAGNQTLSDIGHDPSILDFIAPKAFHNAPELWLEILPRPATAGHKYSRGHAVVVSGGVLHTGAARLAARGALRAGAGLVTVASPPDAIMAHAAHLTAIMLARFYEADGLLDLLADQRKNAVVIGPALGRAEEAAPLVLAALDSEASVVIDADGLTAFAETPDTLFEAVDARAASVVLTPHDGEFGRLFPDLAGLASKPERVRKASERTGAVVVLKGADTTVGTPDGLVSIADNAPPELATAGAGDVLGGIIAGLLAQQMPAFEAASAGVWLHGAAAGAFGPGLIAEDLPEMLPGVLRALHGVNR